MSYDENNRSELERRFEMLVQQAYGLPVEALFITQKRVDINGKSYRIDYVPKNHPHIAIELDGRVKFEQYGETLSTFLDRQNDLVGAGYIPIRFTYEDVTDNQGKKALDRLKPLICEGIYSNPTSTNRLIKGKEISKQTFVDAGLIPHWEEQSFPQSSQPASNKQNYSKLNRSIPDPKSNKGFCKDYGEVFGNSSLSATRKLGRQDGL